jgi:hypothetical protein
MSADLLFVEYLYPGAFFGEGTSKRIADVSEIDVPASAVAYRTFRQTISIVGGEELKGVPRDYSGWTYTVGKEMTVEQVEREMPEKGILISNLRGNGYARCVVFPFGQTYPLNDSDVVVASANTHGVAS